MAAVYTGPCLSLRGGGASAGRKEARKRKFQQMSGLDASSSDREAASRRASAEEIVDEKSRAIKQQDHDANRSVSSPDSAEDARSAEADGKGQGEALEDKSSRTKSKNQRFVVFIGM